MHTYINTYTSVTPGSPLLTDASCLQPNPHYFTHINTHTHAVPSWHPYRLTHGLGGGAAPPCGSPVVFLLILDPVPLGWPTHLSPDGAEYRFCPTAWQDRKLTLLTGLNLILDVNAYQTFCSFYLNKKRKTLLLTSKRKSEQQLDKS